MTVDYNAQAGRNLERKGQKIAEASRQLPHTGHKLAINTFRLTTRN